MPIGFVKTSETGRPWKLRSWKAVIGDKDHGWSPLVWIVYLGFFFMDPVVTHAGWPRWLLDIAGALVFLILYLGIFFLERPNPLIHIGGMVLLGVLYQF